MKSLKQFYLIGEYLNEEWNISLSPLEFTYSKSTMGTLEKGEKYAKS